MPEICSCGHPAKEHPLTFPTANATTNIPPFPGKPCTSPGCDCKHLEEDRSRLTDSERLMRIEDKLNEVLQKLP